MRMWKHQASKQQDGRSMVEMLGVLAIIGVLSVGAIAGYQKAMFKYRLNKQSEFLDHVFDIMTRYKNEWKFGVESVNLIPYYQKLGEISQNIITENGQKIYDVFKNKIMIRTNNCPGDKPCNETLLGYNMNNQTNFDLCHNIFKVGIAYAPYLLYFTVGSTNQEENHVSYDHRYEGDEYCSKSGTNCIRNLTMDNIYEICQSCQDKKSCSFAFIWRVI